MKSVCRSILTSLLVTLSVFTATGRSYACKPSAPISVPHTCQVSEYIIRATAVGNLESPANVDSRITFAVEEVLKGDSLDSTITLRGYLNDKDDFNDHPVPYTFVRPGGRGGSCFARSYKQGAQYLLFLKKTPDGFAVEINALAPVNEQLHSAEDPWVYYVKGLIEGLKSGN